MYRKYHTEAQSFIFDYLRELRLRANDASV